MSGYRLEGSPHYIIDGYNVILHGSYAHGKEEISASRQRFITLLAAYLIKRRVRMTVVWDGSGSAFSRVANEKGVRCIYTAPGMSADEKIVCMVEEMRNRQEVTVVSDDRRHITGSVRNLGAQVLGVEQFLSLVGGMKRRREGPRPYEGEREAHAVGEAADNLSVEEWLTLFKAKEHNE